MGAQLRHHAGPWHPDPNESLRALQYRYAAEHYDLAAVVRDSLDSARQAVRLTERDGDEYNLLGTYREELGMLEGIAAAPLPTGPPDRVALLRLINRYEPSNTGDVLAVTEVVVDWRPHTIYTHEARLMRLDQVAGYCGTDRPTREQAEAAVGPINRDLGRGESY